MEAKLFAKQPAAVDPRFAEWPSLANLPAVRFLNECFVSAEQSQAESIKRKGTRLLDLRALDPNIPVYIVGDLHARTDRFERVLREFNLRAQCTKGQACLLLLGDLIHNEVPKDLFWSDPCAAAKRLEDMHGSLQILSRYLALKRLAPEHVHMLLGNHDPVQSKCEKYKVAQSGLFADALIRHSGTAAAKQLIKAQSTKPLFARGHGFAAVHAGPIKKQSHANPAHYSKPTNGYALDQVHRDALCERDFEPKDVSDFLTAIGCDPKKDKLIRGHDPRDHRNWCWSGPENLITIHGNCARFGVIKAQNNQLTHIEIH